MAIAFPKQGHEEEEEACLSPIATGQMTHEVYGWTFTLLLPPV
jgi:hypothetical protein